MIYYAGIGSRDIDEDMDLFHKLVGLGESFAKLGYILRSGGADGADSAFEIGCDLASGKKEIYLPWRYFNENTSDLVLEPTKELEEITRSIYTRYDMSSRAVQKLHMRNVLQILGQPSIGPKSSFVICWTDRANSDTGGTRFGIALAEKYHIPVINLYEKNWKSQSVEQITRIVKEVILGT